MTKALQHSTFQQDLGGKKESSLQYPPPFRPPATCLWRKQIFFLKIFPGVVVLSTSRAMAFILLLIGPKKRGEQENKTTRGKW